MVSICREMGIVLMKTAYSTIFSEALDFTCGLANMDGDLMAVPDRRAATPRQVLLKGDSSVRDRGGRRHPPQRSVQGRFAHPGTYIFQADLC
jgi:hypothetical protein